MGKHFALTLHLDALNAQPKTRKSRRFAMTSGSKYGTLLFGACCLLAIMYLYQVNSFSTKGFEIGSLQSKITALQDQQKQLQVQNAQLQSLQRIQADPEITSMVPVTSVTYVQNSTLTQR